MALATENLFLEITQGPQQGEEFPIKEGARIGRSHGDWIIKDPKISALHAEITFHPRGFFLLKDVGSRHQILYKGQKVLKVALLPGVIFQLGSTEFRVVKKDVKVKIGPSVEDNPISPEKEVAFKIKQFLFELPPQEIQTSVQLFPYPVQVAWIGGLEYGRTEWISFGPRTFGDWGCDFLIHERVCPPKAFTLIWNTKEAYPWVLTDYPKVVLIDDQAVQKKRVISPIFIKIGTTRLKLSVIRDLDDHR